MRKSLEIETKYDANNISLDTFAYAAYELEPVSVKKISGYDYFFSSKKDKNSFFRYREVKDDIELTFKRKLSKKDNVVRTEFNLKLSEPLLNHGGDFCEELGYSGSKIIYKTACVFEYNEFILCWYEVTGVDCRLIGSFIEIELRNSDDFKNTREAMKRLAIIETECQGVGLNINKKARLSKSLFEMVRDR